MKNTDREFLKRAISFHPFIAKAFGSINLALLWQQIYYWSDKGHDPDGWIYKTQVEIADETALSRKNQETTRKLGEKLGVLESKRMGPQGVIHFRVNLEKAYEIIDKFAEKNPSTKLPFKLKAPEAKEVKVEPASILPQWLNREAWADWEKYRIEKRQKLTPSSRKLQFNFLEKNKEDQVEIIRTSIQNGWTGLFALKRKAVGQVRSTPGKFDNIKSTKV